MRPTWKQILSSAVTPHDVQERAQAEDDLLEQIPMPGVPRHEAHRRRQWLTIPRKARIAIRKCTMS